MRAAKQRMEEVKQMKDWSSVVCYVSPLAQAVPSQWLPLNFLFHGRRRRSNSSFPKHERIFYMVQSLWISFLSSLQTVKILTQQEKSKMHFTPVYHRLCPLELWIFLRGGSCWTPAIFRSSLNVFHSSTHGISSL